MQEEAEAAYADYSNITDAKKVQQSDYDKVRFDEDEYLVKFVANDSVEACHWIDSRGELVDWCAKVGDNYFQFIGNRNLCAESVMQHIKVTQLQELLNDLDSFLQENADYMESPLREKVLNALPEEMKIIR